MKKVKSLSCSTRLGLRNGMKIYVSEMCAVRLVSVSTVTYINDNNCGEWVESMGVAGGHG